MHYTSKEVYEYISTQNNDPIVEWKICAVSGAQFAIYQSDLDFLKKIAICLGEEKIEIPCPSLCPEERQRRRLIQRNERNYYKSTCCFSGQPIITNVNPKL